MNHDLTIRGYDIVFPEKAYPGQIQAMNLLLKALNESENVMLESPTGTGKTFSLLCSVLAYQQKRKVEGEPLKVMYSLATHYSHFHSCVQTFS